MFSNISFASRVSFSCILFCKNCFLYILYACGDDAAMFYFSLRCDVCFPQINLKLNLCDSFWIFEWVFCTHINYVCFLLCAFRCHMWDFDWYQCQLHAKDHLILFFFRPDQTVGHYFIWCSRLIQNSSIASHFHRSRIQSK